MTKVERRIAILKDVLKQLKDEKYKAKTGVYVELPRDLWNLQRREAYEPASFPKSSAQTCLINSTKSCKVCAKGAIFLSLVRKENKVSLVDLMRTSVRESKTNRLFGERNLDKIEAAYEKWVYKDIGSYTRQKRSTGKLQLDIQKFSNKYPDKRDRLVAIVKNAIKNEGIFKP